MAQKNRTIRSTGSSDLSYGGNNEGESNNDDSTNLYNEEPVRGTPIQTECPGCW